MHIQVDATYPRRRLWDLREGGQNDLRGMHMHAYFYRLDPAKHTGNIGLFKGVLANQFRDEGLHVRPARGTRRSGRCMRFFGGPSSMGPRTAEHQSV